MERLVVECVCRTYGMNISRVELDGVLEEAEPGMRVNHILYHRDEVLVLQVIACAFR